MFNSDDLDKAVKAERAREQADSGSATARRARLGTRPRNPAACPQGHEYTPENTLYRRTGQRMCLTCHRARRVYADRPSNRRLLRGQPVIDLSEFPGGAA